MPEVYIHAVEGRTKEQKRALIKDVTDTVVKSFGDDRGRGAGRDRRNLARQGGVLFSER